MYVTIENQNYWIIDSNKKELTSFIAHNKQLKFHIKQLSITIKTQNQRLMLH